MLLPRRCSRADPALFTPSQIGSKYVVSPNGDFMRKWDFMTIMALLYTAVYTPYQIAFRSDMEWTNVLGDPGPGWLGTFIVDRFVDSIFVVDMCLQFRMAWFDHDHKLTFSSGEAATRYLKGWFAIDLVSIIPYDAIAGKSAGRVPKLLRLFRLLKIARILRVSRIIQRWETEWSVKYGALRLIRFLVVVIMVSHWDACLWYLITTFDGDYEPGTGAYCEAVNNKGCLGGAKKCCTWVEVNELCSCNLCEFGRSDTELCQEVTTPWTQYVAALYWSVMTLTTTGYGDIHAGTSLERMFSTASMILGSGIFAYIVGSMCTLVQRLDAHTFAFQRKIDDLNEYMAHREMPQELRRRLRKYFHYGRDLMKFDNEPELLADMSPQLQQEIAYHNSAKHIEHISLFNGMSRRWTSNAALALVHKVFGPSETIIEEGDRGDAMYIMIKGRARVQKMTENGLEEWGTLSEGSYFGERAVLFEAPRPVTVRTISYCEVAELGKPQLDHLFHAFPGTKVPVRRRAIRDSFRKLVQSGRLAQTIKQAATEPRSQVGAEAEDAQAPLVAKLDAQEKLLNEIHGRLADARGKSAGAGDGNLANVEQRIAAQAKSIRSLQEQIASQTEMMSNLVQLANGALAPPA